MSVHRDGPCACGSGKKFKNCCLRREQREAQRTGQHATSLARVLDWLGARYSAACLAAINSDFSSMANDDSPVQPAEIPSGLHQMFQLNAMEWLVARGEILIRRQGTPCRLRVSDLVLGPGGPLLTPGQRCFLEEMARRPIRLYEVLESRPGDGFVLKDALDSELPEYSVRERSGSRQLVQWDIFGARLVPVDDHWEIAGSIYTFGTQGPELVQDIREALDELAEAFPDDEARLDRFVERAVIAGWLVYVTTLPPMPQMVDQGSGESLMLITDHYEVLDWNGLAKALESQPDVDGDRTEGWTRFVSLGEDTRRSLLAINIGETKNRIEPFARTLRFADEGKAWLQQLAGNSIRFLNREAVDPVTIMSGRDRSSGSGERRASASPIPPAQQTRIYQEFYERHYRNWANESIPALGDRTPREAVATQSGRVAVIELLKQYESSEFRKARAEQRDPVRFDFLWQQVGLDRASQLATP